MILLPIAAFTTWEVSKLNENEQVLEEVYREQLSSIIFSINQYSADLFDFYMNQVDFNWSQTWGQTFVDSTFLQQNLAIEGIAIVKKGNVYISDFDKRLELNVSKQQIDSILKQNQAITDRLIRYKEIGYMKSEPLGQLKVDASFLSLNLVIIGKNTPCIVMVNPVSFVEDLLAPKIQEIANQKLEVRVTHLPTGNPIYTMLGGGDGILEKGTLSLFPDYEIGVSLKAKSVDDIIQSRTTQNILTLALLILVVVFGLILVIRNLKKEMQLSKTKADFIANVSHEIRTPLSLISMFNETLLMGRVQTEEKKNEYYEIISKETVRLKNIVNKILSFSQIDADKKNYEFKAINPSEVVAEVMNSYSYHLEANGFSFDVEQLNPDIIIEADKEAFIEVLINLIDNAIKYSEKEKYLGLRSAQEGDEFIVEIMDKGIGIPANKKAQVFEKFYRVEDSNVHNTKGTGLGLSLVSGIVKAHGGRIELESKLGVGSTFKLYFPKAHGN